MKIKFTERNLIRRFGVDPIEVSDSQAVRYMEAGQAVALTSFDSPLLDKVMKEEGTPSSKKAEGLVVGKESGILLLDGYMIQKSMVEQNLATLQ